MSTATNRVENSNAVRIVASQGQWTDGRNVTERRCNDAVMADFVTRKRRFEVAYAHK